MRFSMAAALLGAAGLAAAAPAARGAKNMHNGTIAPKVLIVSLFAPEANVWYEKLAAKGLGNLLAHNVTAPGLSMLFPMLHCVEDYSICQVTTGESEINAAATVMAAGLWSGLDLRQTYVLIAGIAGINPRYGTLGSVALARYTVQVALQYELDAREMPANWTTGYFGYGTDSPDVQPGNQYGTEVLELNAALRDRAFAFAARANLSDDPTAAQYRARFGAGPAAAEFAAATTPPSLIKCDSVTSDVYFSGALLGDAFEDVTRAWTNGTGRYCMTAQEDSAVLEVLVRLTLAGRADFARAVLLRSGSDFDRPPPGVSAFDNLRVADQNGFGIAIDNLFLAGVEIVRGILADWACTFRQGITPQNYIGDIFGSLGGEPDFGPGSTTHGAGYKPASRRRAVRRGVIVRGGAGKR